MIRYDDSCESDSYRIANFAQRGLLWKHKPWVPGQPKPEKNSTLKPISDEIPSDPNSETRQNEIDPDIIPKELPILFDYSK